MTTHKGKLTKQPGLTKGAQIVLDILGETGELASAQDIYGKLRQGSEKAPGLTTVYRALDSLVALGYVQAVDLGDGEKRYEAVNQGEHHHHLVCQQCGRSDHLDQCMVEEFEDAIFSKYGFLVKSHVLEIFGLCTDCQKIR